MEREKLVYGLDDVPKPFTRAFSLGLQHVLTMFGATVAVPLLLAPALGMDAAQTGVLVSSCMLCAGVATFLQVNFGIRLPIVQGMSFAFLGPFFAIINTIVAQGGQTAAEAMTYIAGAIVLGALVEALIGFSGLVGKINKILSPVVIGPVIALIGLSLYGSGAPMAGENWILSGIVIFCAFFFTLVLGKRNKFFSLYPILLAVAVGYGVALIGSLAGIFAPGSSSYVDFTAVLQADWFRVRFLFPWGLPKFRFDFFLVVLAGYLASIIESYGDYHAINYIVQGPELTGKQVSRGIGMEGIACLFAAVFGGFANTSYTENIGLVGLTRVASRYVVNIGAVILLVLGLLGKFGAIVATIPTPVIGGLYCTLFGLIASIGLSNAVKADLTSMRNLMIMGFIMFMGLSVPEYFSSATLEIPWAPWLASIISTIGQTGMAVAAILGLILDNLIPGSLKERGCVE